MDHDCQEIQKSILNLRSLIGRFNLSYSKIDEKLGSKNADNLEAINASMLLMEEIKEKILEFNDSFFNYKFTVKNAVNPYREAFQAGGITNPELIAERKDITVNLQEILTSDRNAYQSSGADIWAEALPKAIWDFNLTDHELSIIQMQIEKGEIPIFMPGKEAQLKGLNEAMDKLMPLWIKDGQKQAIKNTNVWSYVGDLIKGYDQSLIQGIPDKPYILLISPSQSPESGRDIYKTEEAKKRTG